MGHPDFRCFVTAEPPGLPDQMLIPEGIMQAAIKVANEPPTDVKSLFRSALALFSQVRATLPPNLRGLLQITAGRLSGNWDVVAKLSDLMWSN